MNKWGGAERVLLALHEIFPDAPLFTSVYHPKTAPWAKVFKVKTSFLQHIPFAKSHHQFLAPLMPFAFWSFNFDVYDVVLSVTSESAKGIHTHGATKHICLCLTPTRYLWSGYEEYFPHKILRVLLHPVIAVLRWWDKMAAGNPHKFIAISQEVKRRIQKYYQRNAFVLYPPLTLPLKNKGLPTRKTMRRATRKKGYFLVVSRLSRFTQYKRVDIAIQAATKLHLPLVVIGEGNAAYLKKYAGPTVTFVEKVPDDVLQEYYKNAKALIFPALEDFGLVMVEANAAGIPVIAFKGGGAMEIIQEGITGEFFSQQSVSSLIRVLKTFDETRYNRKSLRENAKRFSFSHFEKSLKEYILRVLE